MPNPTDQPTDDPSTPTGEDTGGTSDVQGGGSAAGSGAESGGSASPSGADAVDDLDEAAGELLITLEGDDAAANDGVPEEVAEAPWVNTLRRENRQKDKRLRELERQLAERNPTPQAVVAGPKPTLEGCDFDSGRFERELSDWMGRDAEAKRVQGEHAKALEKQQSDWQKRLGDVESAATSLRIVGADEAREAFEGGLSVIQQAIVMNGPEDAKTSAMLRAVIGANPAVVKRLAAIQDPVKYAFAVADLVHKMKTNRKSAPAPERRLTSGAVGTAAVDDALAKARERADKTGDRSEVARLIRMRTQRAG